MRAFPHDSDASILEKLVVMGADMTIKDDDNQTALMYVVPGDITLVDCVLKHINEKIITIGD